MRHSQVTRAAARGGATRWPQPAIRQRGAPGRDRCALTHVGIPLAVFALVLWAMHAVHADRQLAAWLFAWEGQRWALRDAFWTQQVVHLLGRDFSLAAWCGVLAAWLAARIRPSLHAWRTPLAYLLLSTLLATVLVAWIKSWSNMDCPWDLQGLGGTRPYIGLFEVRPVGLGRGRCFPAGHASAGYAWVSLYFFLAMARPPLRWIGLATGLGAGLLFGISQQLRGAHFLSHDLWTAMLCWLVAAGVHALFRERLERREREAAWEEGAPEESTPEEAAWEPEGALAEAARRQPRMGVA
jgi:membrane-associated PAP2 superfamily phosphatase